MKFLKKINMVTGYVIFFLLIPQVFSPEIKKKSFFLSLLLSLAVCMIFISLTGLKNHRRWGIEGLVLTYGLILLCFILIKSFGFYFYLNVTGFVISALTGFFLYKNLKKGF